jgi:serine/threonine protein phosphatase 1
VSRTVVGDVHGCFDELSELLDAAELRPDDLLVAAGDVVDRGPAPGEVVRFLRKRPNTVVVMGNHERKHVRGEHVRVVHAAMLSGVPPAEQREEVLCGSTSGEKELAALFPEDHWHDHYADAKPVVFGHHIVGDEPMVRDGRIFGLDTGACHGGRLTALSVPDFTIHSVAAHADHWSAAKREWQLPVLRSRPWLDLTWAELAEGDRAVRGGPGRGELAGIGRRVGGHAAGADPQPGRGGRGAGR